MNSTRVMIVDDEKIICDSFSRVLTDCGYTVECYSNGSEAIKRLSEQKFDIFLVDVKMPSMNGIDLSREIRKIHENARIVVVTGYASDEVKAEAEAAGAASFVSKPVSPDQLVNVVNETLAAVARTGEAVKEIARTFETAKPEETTAATGEERKTVPEITVKLVAGSLLGLAFVIFLPLVGLGMLAWLMLKKTFLQTVSSGRNLKTKKKDTSDSCNLSYRHTILNLHLAMNIAKPLSEC